jgi:hypothetical protein
MIHDASVRVDKADVEHPRLADVRRESAFELFQPPREIAGAHVRFPLRQDSVSIAEAWNFAVPIIAARSPSSISFRIALHFKQFRVIT